jgi:hypothetical protein
MPVEAKQSWSRVKWVVVKVEVDKVRLDHYQSESKFVNVMEQTMGWLVGRGRGCKKSRNPIPTNIYLYIVPLPLNFRGSLHPYPEVDKWYPDMRR